MNRLSWMMSVLVVGLALLPTPGCGEGGTAGNTDGGGDSGQAPDGAGGGSDAGVDGGGIPGTEALRPVRRTSYRRITSFQRGADAKFISDAKISADGSTIIFGTIAGTYTIAADGSKLVQLSDKRNNGHGGHLGRRQEGRLVRRLPRRLRGRQRWQRQGDAARRRTR